MFVIEWDIDDHWSSSLPQVSYQRRTGRRSWQTTTVVTLTTLFQDHGASLQTPTLDTRTVEYLSAYKVGHPRMHIHTHTNWPLPTTSGSIMVDSLPQCPSLVSTYLWQTAAKWNIRCVLSNVELSDCFWWYWPELLHAVVWFSLCCRFSFHLSLALLTISTQRDSVCFFCFSVYT